MGATMNNEREEARKQKDLEERHGDRIKLYNEQHSSSQDFIVIKWPSKEQEQQANSEELSLIRELRRRYKPR
jgi:hypothetical protein